MDHRKRLNERFDINDDAFNHYLEGLMEKYPNKDWDAILENEWATSDDGWLMLRWKRILREIEPNLLEQISVLYPGLVDAAWELYDEDHDLRFKRYFLEYWRNSPNYGYPATSSKAFFCPANIRAIGVGQKGFYGDKVELFDTLAHSGKYGFFVVVGTEEQKDILKRTYPSITVGTREQYAALDRAARDEVIQRRIKMGYEKPDYTGEDLPIRD